MALKLYYHPFAAFCQKALIAFYEKDVPFEPVFIDLGNPDDRERLEAVWPLIKFPVLVDEERQVTLPESSVVIEYVDSLAPDRPQLVPEELDAALRVRVWDRFFDSYVSQQLTRLVLDRIRPEDARDPHGAEEAKALIARSYAIAEDALAEGPWFTGDSFTLADCSAAPALFYANTQVPIAGHERLAAYYERLLRRPSVARVVEEARPYRHLFPLPWPDSYA